MNPLERALAKADEIIKQQNALEALSRPSTAVTCPTCGSSQISVTLQSWETVTYGEGVETGSATDRESLDFFVSASCDSATCPSLSGSGWKEREVVDPAGNIVDNPPLFDAWSTLVEYLTR